MNIKIHLFILVFSACLFSYGQHPITGKVVDADQREGLIGAHVYLLNNWRKGAITDVEGNFTLILDDAEKNDSLVISYIGFREVIIPVSDKVTIVMEPMEKEGETVVVTAKPLIAEEFKYMEIKKIDIYTNPAAKADPLLAVNSLPSSTTTDESANISLRGSSPIETGVFLNNVPIYDGIRYSQLNGIGTFSIFNTAIIKNVTVFPGNPPLEFGNATSGIISMETDDMVVEDNTNSLILSLANVGYSREQAINENQSLKIFSNWQPSGAIKKLNEKALEDIESFTSNDLGIYWYGSNEKLKWKILNYSVTEGYQFNFEHPTFQGIFDQSKQRSFLISSLTSPFGAGSITLNNGISYSAGNYAYSNVAFQVDKKDVFAGINYLLNNSHFSVKTGISYDHRYSQVRGDVHEFFYALGPNHPTITLNEDADVRILEGFGYFKYFLSDKLAFGTGLRKNLPFEDDRSYLSSHANLSYSDQVWTITIGAGLYNKYGLFENTGQPFQAENFQKSIDVKRKEDGLEIAVSLFDKEGEVDNSSYHARGVEIFTDYRLSSRIRVSGSITLLDAQNDSDDYTYDLSYFIRGNASYSPGRFWTIESTLVARQGSSYSPVLSSDYNAGLDAYQPFFGENNQRFENYANVGISVSKIFALSAEFNVIAFASVNNVLDRKNPRNFSYNFDYSERDQNFYSRRTGYLGIVINF
ncbi:carboxypeptidase-like regulatory domain-containing protein [Ekhidna sp.]|uniref:carboxypeptidase-like regulatory domain-containing protein n=1 Tax=Ekhidna sp. TaxID=2608089 RepID=UPI003B507B75